MYLPVQGGSIEFILSFFKISSYLLCTSALMMSWMTLSFHSYILCANHIYVGCFFFVRVKWVYTVSQGYVISIVILMHVLYVFQGSITRNNCQMSFSTHIYICQFHPFLTGSQFSGQIWLALSIYCQSGNYIV